MPEPVLEPEPEPEPVLVPAVVGTLQVAAVGVAAFALSAYEKPSFVVETSVSSFALGDVFVADPALVGCVASSSDLVVAVGVESSWHY